MTGYYTAPVDPTSVDEVDISKMANHRHLLEDIVAANGDEARYLHESMKANRVNLTVPFTEPGYMSLTHCHRSDANSTLQGHRHPSDLLPSWAPTLGQSCTPAGASWLH